MGDCLVVVQLQVMKDVHVLHALLITHLTRVVKLAFLALIYLPIPPAASCLILRLILLQSSEKLAQALNIDA